MTDFRAGDRVRYTGKSRTYAEPPFVGSTGTVVFAGDRTVEVKWDGEGPKPADFVFAANIEPYVPAS